MATIQELQDFTQQVRRDILRMVHAVNSGHPGGSLGCAEFFTVLYQEVLEYSTEFSMDGKNENLFFLSNSVDNIDPESAYNSNNSQGLEYWGMPVPRTVGVNVNLKF